MTQIQANSGQFLAEKLAFVAQRVEKLLGKKLVEYGLAEEDVLEYLLRAISMSTYPHSF